MTDNTEAIDEVSFIINKNIYYAGDKTRTAAQAILAAIQADPPSFGIKPKMTKGL